MFRFFLFFFIFTLTITPTKLLIATNEEANRPSLPLFPPTFLEKAEKKEIVTSISVTTTEKKKQKLTYKVMGIHPQSCSSSLRILSRYENFPKYLSFLKESQYDQKINELSLLFDSELLPYPLRLVFKLPRMDKVGDYPFIFPRGFFPGLAGTIYVRDHSHYRCLFYIEADWEGDQSKISGTVLELFLITVTKHGMEKLFRISTL